MVWVPYVPYMVCTPQLVYIPLHPNTESEPTGEHGKKRHGSHSKSISLELIYKSKGIEQQITISPVHRTQKKSVEWLRALKKVRGRQQPGNFPSFTCMHSPPISVTSALQINCLYETPFILDVCLKFLVINVSLVLIIV